jgi:benzoyl-CoA 2,3-epoxidase subunit A
MSAVETMKFQHVIDPENCARCGCCEMECERGAISHDERNYVVDPNKCESCLQCLEVCSTGSIDAWLAVRPGNEFSLAEQLAWSSLPQAPLSAADTAVQQNLSGAALVIADAVHHAAPPSASMPQINLFTVHAPVLATIAETRSLAAGNDIRHIVLDFGDRAFPVLEGQTIGILTPGNDTDGRAHVMRAYSVASARDGEYAGTNTVALTVKRIVENYAGQPVRGVCSNFLCDLQIGDRVRVVGPYGQSFLMPDAAGTKILMICTGTGIAPMRGMIERRCRQSVTDGGDLFLFYGARSPAEMPYYDDLIKLPRRRLDRNLAFSRVVGQQRLYVQDMLLRCNLLVMKLLRDPQCYIYLCGVRGMEAGVMQVFAEICAMYGSDWPALKEQLHEQRRLHIETY